MLLLAVHVVQPRLLVLIMIGKCVFVRVYVVHRSQFPRCRRRRCCVRACLCLSDERVFAFSRFSFMLLRVRVCVRVRVRVRVHACAFTYICACVHLYGQRTVGPSMHGVATNDAAVWSPCIHSFG